MRREAAHASPTFFPAEFVGTLTRRDEAGWIVGNLSISLGAASPEASLATPRLAGLKTQTGQRFRIISQPLPAKPSLQSTHIHSLCLSPLVCILTAARAFQQHQHKPFTVVTLQWEVAVEAEVHLLRKAGLHPKQHRFPRCECSSK